ncbi:hypothetical protein [Candidatus Enterococcus lemimoniae]|uniref:Uncharacterized protein n=1 Tax=Candidatus Enterococcus lemimoniae TaxID=1834167 RepID=A0ABZ2T7D0_9ENTE|nr:hypothetical protein [Enterococcus sp. 12C11_DIV0727]OTO68722.1 hypothetical protein A5866_000920 [Enterococcus sp. 12C11_DIV0727]
MIQHLNKKISKLNKKLGVTVQVPEFTSNRLNQSAVMNLIIGGGFATAGVLFEREELFYLGGLGLLSSIVMSFEAKKLK